MVYINIVIRKLWICLNLEINDIKLNEKFDKKGYEVNKKIKFDRFKFYNNKAHPDLTVKVREKDNIVKGIILVRDEKIHTNFDGGIGLPSIRD